MAGDRGKTGGTGFQPVSSTKPQGIEVQAGGTGFQPINPTKAPDIEVGASGTGFQPVSPWTSESLTVGRRHLPHLQVNGATYFVTFRCRPRLCLPPTGRTIVLNAIRYWDGNRIDLDAAVVMPDHAHAILRITDGSALETILHSIKSFSANRVNRLLQRRGAFWQDENFDHIVRGETDWQNKLEYVRNNPVKKGLCDNPEGYPWLYVRNLQ